MSRSKTRTATPNVQISDRLATEYVNAARTAKSLQESTSRILEKSNHPDLVEEMHILQDLDRLQQTLEDLASVAHLLVSLVDDQAILAEILSEKIKLASLRNRLFLEGQDGDQETPSGEVSWL